MIRTATPGDPWAALTYRVSDSARLGRIRAAALHEVVRAHDVVTQVRHGIAGTTVEVWGPRSIVEHLDATLPQLAAQLDAAALAATGRYGAWLRDQDDPDHMPRERTGLCRAWRRSYIESWGHTYARRLLTIALGQDEPPAGDAPPIGHHTAHAVAAHDVDQLDPAPLRQAIAIRKAPRSPDVDEPEPTPDGGPGMVGPGLRVSCLPGALPAGHGQPLADIIAIGPTTSQVRICGEDRHRRIRNELLRPTWAPRIAEAARRRGIPTSYPDWRRTLPGWQWLTWTVAEHLEYARGERALPGPPPAPARLIIVACGARKQPEYREHPAGQLYTGSYHQAARRAAAAIAGPDDQVVILSAQHGLLHLDDQVLPYEQRLGQPGAVTADYVREQARQMGLLPTTDVMVLAGRAYADLVAAVWPHAARPLNGTTGIGHQLARLAAIAAGRPIPGNQREAQSPSGRPMPSPGVLPGRGSTDRPAAEPASRTQCGAPERGRCGRTRTHGRGSSGAGPSCRAERRSGATATHRLALVGWPSSGLRHRGRDRRTAGKRSSC